MTSSYLHFPEFDPVIFSIGPVALHWYGLMYLVGFIFAMWLATRRANRPGSGWTKNEVENLLYAGFLGVFLGGRIGYVLFYNFPQFMADPLYLFRVWDGGMSFHGGLIGVIVVMIIFARRTKRSFFQVSDFIAPLIPFGLGAGRLGNFINGELWGRVDPNFPFAAVPSAPVQKIFCCCKPTRSGNPFSTLTVCCRATHHSFTSCCWKVWCCLLSSTCIFVNRAQWELSLACS